jgi:hypothetical protein
VGNDGNSYGTTHLGGSGGFGSVFRLLFPPLITVQPQSQITGVAATVTLFVS